MPAKINFNANPACGHSFILLGNIGITNSMQPIIPIAIRGYPK
jgi:hypothetical protein